MNKKPVANDANGKPISVGDFVRVEKITEGLLKDLPADEQKELKACVGKVLRVEEIDERGNVWLGIGETNETRDESRYSGHSFSLDSSCVACV